MYFLESNGGSLWIIKPMLPAFINVYPLLLMFFIQGVAGSSGMELWGNHLTNVFTFITSQSLIGRRAVCNDSVPIKNYVLF